MSLSLIKKKLFGNLEIECYEDSSVENSDFYMTRKQLYEGLEYENINSFHKVIQRNKDVIGEPITMDILSTMINKSYSTELYSFKQIFQVLRFSKQPKANLFMEWASETLMELITNRAELRFHKESDKEKYENRIEELQNSLSSMEIKLDNTMDKLETLINNSTINQYQSKQVNKAIRERVKELLGGSVDTPQYKKDSRRYFKRLHVCLADYLGVSSYLDMSPMKLDDCYFYIAVWQFIEKK